MLYMNFRPIGVIMVGRFSRSGAIFLPNKIFLAEKSTKGTYIDVTQWVNNPGICWKEVSLRPAGGRLMFSKLIGPSKISIKINISSDKALIEDNAKVCSPTCNSAIIIIVNNEFGRFTKLA